jgi:DNA-binding NarL/FixJ family response regulator
VESGRVVVSERGRVDASNGVGSRQTGASRCGVDRAIRVLLADSHQLLAQALAFVLRAERGLEVVGNLSDLASITEQARRAAPDVILVSYRLLVSDRDGLIASLRAEFPDLKLLVLTSTLDDDTLYACVRASAVGCVNKESPPEELIRAIKRAYAGEVLFAPSILVRLLAKPPRGDAPELRPPNRPLAPRELEVLRTLATGVSTGEAAERLGVTPHTVRTHLKSALRKLDARSKLEAIMIALKSGSIALPD